MNAKKVLRGAKDVVKMGLGRHVRPQLTYARAYCNTVSNLDDLLMDTAWRAVYGDGVDRFVLKFESEQLPSLDNRVALSDRRDAWVNRGRL